MSEDEYVLVQLETYVDEAELEIDYSGGQPTVENHDEVEKEDVVYALSHESVAESDLESKVIDEDSPYWRDEFADLEAGDSVPLSRGEA